MQAIRIEKTLHHGADEHVVIAQDPAQRCYVGVSSGQGGPGDFMFVEIDRVTLLELERGTTDATTVMRDRCAGIVVLPIGQ
jgi:hypothetical protein